MAFSGKTAWHDWRTEPQVLTFRLGLLGSHRAILEREFVLVYNARQPIFRLGVFCHTPPTFILLAASTNILSWIEHHIYKCCCSTWQVSLNVAPIPRSFHDGLNCSRSRNDFNFSRGCLLSRMHITNAGSAVAACLASDITRAAGEYWAVG